MSDSGTMQEADRAALSALARSARYGAALAKDAERDALLAVASWADRRLAATLSRQPVLPPPGKEPKATRRPHGGGA